jgi:hypothetical protein
MQRLFDRAGSAGNSRITLPTMLPSARTHGVGTPDCINFAALSPRPTCTPTDASPPPSRTADARLGAIVVRQTFDVERSHLLLRTGFIPALSGSFIRIPP